MQEQDVDAALALIHEVDEDDGEEAAESYADLGLENQFVLTQGNTVIGVTGCRSAKGAHQTYWISWTYIHLDQQGQGFGGTNAAGIIGAYEGGKYP